MFLKRNPLSRRSILKGSLGVIGLPLLDAMVPAFASTVSAPQRFLGIFVPHGAAPGYWIPEGNTLDTLPFLYQDFAPIKNKTIITSGMWCESSENPPGVETNLEPKEGDAVKTLRQRLEQHRADPSWAACHKLFEPMGMAMENMSAVGAWRTTEVGLPIDSYDPTADGTELHGLNSLRELTVAKGDMFSETVIEKLLTYSIGRGIETKDMPMVRAIAYQAKADNYRFSSVISAIVSSPAFTQIGDKHELH